MMSYKKYILLFIITLSICFLSLLLNPFLIIAQSTPSATISTNNNDMIDKIKQIENLKEKIATKVAEIRKSEIMLVTGNINKINDNEIQLETEKGVKTIFVGEDSNIYEITGNSKKNLNQKDLSPGTEISVLGYQSDDNSTLSAKFVYIYDNKIRLNGKILNIDKDNFTLTVKTKDGEYELNFERSSKANLINKTDTVEKSGFSKIKVQDFIHAYCQKNETENSYSIIKLLHFNFDSAQSTVSAKNSSPSATVKPT
jgi:hypothetical protein